MKIKQLDVRTAWVNLLDQRFDLLVDGELLRDLVDATNKYGVPLWLTESPYPSLPDWSKKAGRMLYSVCGCGEWGCGSESFQISSDETTVKFFDFESCSESERATTSIQFTRANFETTMNSIREAGSMFRQLNVDYKTAAKQGSTAIQQMYLKKFDDLLASDDEFQKLSLKALITKLLEPDAWRRKPEASAEWQLISDGQVWSDLERIREQL